MTWVSVGVAAVGIGTSVVKGVKANKERKRLEKERPQYEIDDEAFESKEIAKRQAFGEVSEITAAKTSLEQSVADTMGQATKISDSGSGLLATLSAISSQKQKSYLGLASTEASIKSQRLGDLYRSNRAMIEERDKAFEYNVAAPYADKLSTLRDQKTQRTENWMRAADIAGGITASALSPV